MHSDDNDVNIEKRAYHHGDLRAALIREGLRLLAGSDADALSLRAVARAAGVSATAVYRHFPDKDALMTALAQEGLAQLATAQRAAAAPFGGGRGAFAATGRAYVRFALGHPALFRLIFTTPVLTHDRPGQTEDLSVGTEARDLLYANAAAMAARAAGGAEPQVHAVRAWALVHGLALLMLDGQIPVDEGLIDRVVDVE